MVTASSRARSASARSASAPSDHRPATAPKESGLSPTAPSTSGVGPTSPSPASTPAHARQVRKDDTRARLFAAAASLFDERGCGATTVADVVARAGVAKGTFFLHFKTKDAVAAELVGVQVKAARRAGQAARDRGPLAALRATVMALGEQAGASRGLTRAVLAATLENPAVGGHANALFASLQAELEEDARQARRRGDLPKRSDPATVASALLAAYLGAAFHFATAEQPAPLASGLAPLVDAQLESRGEAPTARSKSQQKASRATRRRK